MANYRKSDKTAKTELPFACMTLMVGIGIRKRREGKETELTSVPPQESLGNFGGSLRGHLATLTRILGIAPRTTFLLCLTRLSGHDLGCDIHVPHQATPGKAAQSVLLKLHRFQPRRAAARVTFSLDHWCEALRCTYGLTHLSITASQSADKIILDPG